MKGIEKKKVRREPYTKTAGIFAGIMGIPINLEFVPHSSLFLTDGTNIKLPETYDEEGWSPYYTSFEHELSHIVFNTDTKIASGYISNLRQEWRPVGHFILNVLEDNRVDSLWGAVYPGTEVRSKRMLAQACKKLNRKLLRQVPVQKEMLAMQFFYIYAGAKPRNKLQRYFKKCLNDVRWKSFEASIVIWREVMRVIQSLFNKNQERRSQGKGNTNFVFCDDGECDSEISVLMPNVQLPGDGSQSDDEEDEDDADGDNEENGKTSGSGKKSKDDDDSENLGTSADELVKELNEQLQKLMEAQNGSSYEMKGGDKARQDLMKKLNRMRSRNAALKKAAQKAQDEVNELIVKLTKRPKSAHKKKDAPSKSMPECYLFDDNFRLSTIENIARAIRKRLLKFGKVGTGLCDEGTEIDFPAYIDYKLNQNKSIPEFFKEEKPVLGMLVTILIDQSGSMSGEKIKRAATVGAILKLALEHIAKVEVVSYYSSGRECYMHNCTVQNLRRMGAASGCTPTDLALDWARAHGEENKLFTKRMILLVTDSYPYHPERMPEAELMESTRQSVQIIKERKVAFHAVNIGNYREDPCKFMYGKDYSNVEYDEITTAIMRRVLEEVIITAKNRM